MLSSEPGFIGYVDLIAYYEQDFITYETYFWFQRLNEAEFNEIRDQILSERNKEIEK